MGQLETRERSIQNKEIWGTSKGKITKGKQ